MELLLLVRVSSAPELDEGGGYTRRLAAAPRQRHLVPDRLPHVPLVHIVHQAAEPQQHRRQPQERQAVLQGLRRAGCVMCL